MEDVQGRFPSYFDAFEMPPGAQPQRITVHRACGTGAIDRRSFLSTFEEQGCEYQEGDDPEDPGLYSSASINIIIKYPLIILIFQLRRWIIFTDCWKPRI